MSKARCRHSKAPAHRNPASPRRYRGGGSRTIKSRTATRARPTGHAQQLLLRLRTVRDEQPFVFPRLRARGASAVEEIAVDRSLRSMSGQPFAHAAHAEVVRVLKRARPRSSYTSQATADNRGGARLEAWARVGQPETVRHDFQMVYVTTRANSRSRGWGSVMPVSLHEDQISPAFTDDLMLSRYHPTFRASLVAVPLSSSTRDWSDWSHGLRRSLPTGPGFNGTSNAALRPAMRPGDERPAEMMAVAFEQQATLSGRTRSIQRLEYGCRLRAALRVVRSPSVRRQ